MYSEILAAHERIRPHIKQLPLYYSHIFSEKFGGDVFFKLENLQRTGSFKIRGAVNALLSNLEKCQNGVVTASAGNHAQGVAFGAQQLGISAIIVMPVATPLVKIENTKRYGAEVILQGASYDEAYAHACLVAEETGRYMIHPFNDPDVIAGQGTIAHEILSEKQDIDQIIVPIGGGGLISGIASYVKQVMPRVRVVGVQAENAAGMLASVKAGRLVRLSSSATIAEGIAVKAVGELTYSICKRTVDEILTVTENEIAAAVLTYLEQSKLVVEGAGATPLALALARKIDLAGKKNVFVLSGGNIDVNLISRIISRGLASTGRFVELSVTLKDVPGTLATATRVISEAGANIIDIRHYRFDINVNIGYTRVVFELETRGASHITEVIQIMKDKGYDVFVIT